MAKTWVLHTETKGTGAQMVPLESVSKAGSAVEPVLVPRKTKAEPKAPEPVPRTPRRFKVIDVMTRQTLGDNASTREVVDILTGVRSIVDVDVYMRQDEAAHWRRLTFAEQRALMDLAAEAASAAVAAEARAQPRR
jgi:hypothetical protein